MALIYSDVFQLNSYRSDEKNTTQHCVLHIYSDILNKVSVICSDEMIKKSAMICLQSRNELLFGLQRYFLSDRILPGGWLSLLFFNAFYCLSSDFGSLLTEIIAVLIFFNFFAEKLNAKIRKNSMNFFSSKIHTQWQQKLHWENVVHSPQWMHSAMM